MPKINYTRRAREMRHLLEEMATELGSETKFVKRQSKMTATSFCQTFILGSLEDGKKSLNDFAQIAQELGVEITPSGLNQRLNEPAVDCLKKMLAKSIALNLETTHEAPFLDQFSDVQLVDSSYMGLPKELADLFPGVGRATTAGLKLFLNYSYRFGQIKALEVASGRTTDQTHQIHIEHAQENSLTLFDLGFFNQTLFERFDAKGAYYLVRYQNQTALYTHLLERIDLHHFLKTTNDNEIDLSLRIGSKVKTPVRLIALRLPQDVAEQRRRKAKEKAQADGRRPTLSAARLALLDWAIFVTNVPSDLLSVEQITLVYRLRWQIELIFKVWKSSAKLKEIGQFRPTRVLAQLFARLTALVLFHFLIAPTIAWCKELSLTKAFSCLKRHAIRLIDALSGSLKDLSLALKKIDQDLLRFGRMDKRNKTPSTYQLLVEAGL